MDYEILDVTGEMIPQILEIERECFSCPWTEEQLKSQITNDRNEFLAAVKGEGQVLGYVGMSFVLDEGYISNVAVSEMHRGCGVGLALVSQLLRRVDARGLAFVTLEARESNQPALALYGRLGFVPVGRRRGYYLKPREDAILMTYYFESRQKSEDTCI